MTQTKQPKTASKFTPGPWRLHVLAAKRGCDGTSAIYAGEQEICHGRFMADPDARLIAAAPEMYELLETIESHYHDAPGPYDWEAIVNVSRRIKAAIDGEG